MDTWPIELQQRLNQDSFEFKYGSTNIRTDMEVGPAKVRRRYTDAVDIYTCSIVLDHAEKPIFDTFYRTTLSQGSLPFLFVDPFSEVEEVFRFIEPPAIRPMGGRKYQVGMQWERMPTHE